MLDESARKRNWLDLPVLAVLIVVLTLTTACSGKHHDTKCERLEVVSNKRQFTVGYIPPTRGLFDRDDGSYVVYLHGLGGSWLHPFQFPRKHTYADTGSRIAPGVLFMSVAYCSSLWADASAIDDITASINTLARKYPCKQIILTGCSMGGATALSYAAQAPPEIKAKIKGVVAMYPAGDLIVLHEKTHVPLVRAALEQCLGGPPTNDTIAERYLKMSLIPNIAKFPKTAKVYVMSATADSTIPPVLQKDLVDALSAAGVQVQLEDIDGPHDNLPSYKSYSKGLKYAMGPNGVGSGD